MVRNAPILAALLLCGCIVFPDRALDSSGHKRGYISEQDRAQLAPGRATREDVLCTVGAPDYGFDDGRRLVYWIHERRWSWIFYIVLDGAGGEFGVDHYHVFDFDAQGLLVGRRDCSESYEGESNRSPAHVERATRPAAALALPNLGGATSRAPGS